MQLEKGLYSDLMANFAIKVGVHGKCNVFVEKLYLITLVALANGRAPSDIFTETYCPREIVNYYIKHPSRINMLDSYRFDDLTMDDAEKFDAYVKQTAGSLDRLISRFSGESFAVKLSMCPERVKMAIWACIVTPPTIVTVYEMDDKTNEEAANVLTASEDRIFIERVLQFTSL